jgi:hypothetical protein
MLSYLDTHIVVAAEKMDGEGLASVEEALVKEIGAIMSSFSVRDRDGFYNKVARSIWVKEPLEVFSKSFLLVTKMSQQIMYERQVARGKRAAVWNAIGNSIAINDILAVCHSISSLFYSYHHIFQASWTDLVHHEVTVILSRQDIPDENSFYSKVVESILNGSGTLGQVLEDELSYDEIETVVVLFNNNMVISSPTKP